MPSHFASSPAVKTWAVLRATLWIAWLAYALSLFWRPFLWHAEQFRNPGPGYFKAFLLAMPIFLMGCGLYLILRGTRPSWRSWELPALILLPLGISLAYEPRAMLTVLVLLASAYGWGAAVLRRLGLTLRSDSESLLLPLITGWISLMVLLFPAGLLGLLRPWLDLALAAGGLVAGRRELAALPGTLNRLRKSWTEDRSLASGLAGFCIPWLLLFAAMSTLTALAPSRVWDALRHHLYTAIMYAQWGALRPVEGIPYSFFPQGVELMMAIVLPFGGQIAAQLTAAAFFPMLAGLCWLIARECGAGRHAAILGITLLLAVPAVNWSSSVAKNDAALAVCILAGLYAYLRFLGERSTIVLLWGAFLLAAALHVKQPAVFGGLAVTVLFLHAAWKSGRPARIVAQVALIGILVAPAYFVRAAWYTGNPLYPEEVNDAVMGTLDDYQERRTFGGRMVQVFREVNFAGQVAWEYTSPSANPLGASLVVFAPLLLLALPLRHGWWAVVVFACIYYLGWATMFATVRYIVAPLSVLLALLATQFTKLWDEGQTLVRLSLSAALVFCLLFGLWGTMLVEVNAPLLAYFTGRMNRGEYLSAITQDYASLAATLKLAGPRDTIRGVVNCAGAYADHPERFTCNPCSRRWCSPESVREELSRGNFDWVILTKRDGFHLAIEPFLSTGRAKQFYEDQYYTVYRVTHEFPRRN